MLEDPSWAQDKFKNGKAYSVSTEQAQLYIALAKEGERQRFWTIFWKVAIFGTVILGVIGYMVYLTIKKKKTR